MLHSKELASPKQTALDKDISNLLVAGRLPKTTLPTRLPSPSNDLLPGGKDSLKLKELMDLYIDEDVEINLEEAQAKPYRMDLEHPKKVHSMQDVNDEEPAKVEEVREVVTAAN
nr:hypothetical protein [Tanacetum cinerariifolium]